MIILFYISAAAAVISTLLVVTLKNAVHSLLYLIVSLLSSAVIFYMIGAPFIAALEVIIYAGAIMVLFVFVIMMLNLGDAEDSENKLFYPGIWTGPVILSVILLIMVVYLLLNSTAGQIESFQSHPKEVGTSLFSIYLIAVELAGFLLLSGIVGAYHLGQRKKKTYHRFLQEDNIK